MISLTPKILLIFVHLTYRSSDRSFSFSFRFTAFLEKSPVHNYVLFVHERRRERQMTDDIMEEKELN